MRLGRCDPPRRLGSARTALSLGLHAACRPRSGGEPDADPGPGHRHLLRRSAWPSRSTARPSPSPIPPFQRWRSRSFSLRSMRSNARSSRRSRSSCSHARNMASMPDRSSAMNSAGSFPWRRRSPKSTGATPFSRRFPTAGSPSPPATFPGSQVRSNLTYLRLRSRFPRHPPAFMARSKIVLDATSKFPHGAHERIWYGMAEGAAILTDRSTYMEQDFTHGADILFLPLGAISPRELADVPRFLDHLRRCSASSTLLASLIAENIPGSSGYRSSITRSARVDRTEPLP